MLKYFTVNTTAEIICLVVAAVCLKKDKSIVWRSMILFLLITCITELLGVYFKKPHQSNSNLYNVLLIFQIGFTCMMFQLLISRYVNSKPIVISGLAVLTALYLYDTFKNNNFSEYNETANTGLRIMIMLFGLFYYYCLLKAEEYVDLRYLPGFWWVAGILIFYFGTSVIKIFLDHMEFKKIPMDVITLYVIIFKTSNVIYYGCWSYSFICRRWLVKI